MSECTHAGDVGCGEDAGVRVIRRLDVREGPTGEGDGRDTRVGIVVDVETTGLDAGTDVVIELAVRRFRFDADGVVTGIGRPYSWVEDPGRPLPTEISTLTGLSDADVAGRTIDDDLATKLFRSADLVVAHHSRFDRPRVEARLPGIAGLDWACSMEDIDWRSFGFDGRSLGFLLMQAGHFHEGHRAGADVDAVVQLLRHRFGDGRSALSVMMENVARPSWLVRAIGADFGVKDRLRARGYRWDGAAKVWWREIADHERSDEDTWLAANVYDFDARPRALGPEFVAITAATRFL